MPIDCDEEYVRIAFWDPKRVSVIESAGIMLGREIRAVLATKAQVLEAIEKYRRHGGIE